MDLILQVDEITKENAEGMIGRFANILEKAGHKIIKMEISETVETEYKLKDDVLYEETFFQHKLVKQ